MSGLYALIGFSLYFFFFLFIFLICSLPHLSLSFMTNLGLETASYAQIRLTLSDPMDCSLPGSAVHGILPAWGAISFCRGSSGPRDRAHVSSITRWIIYHKLHVEIPFLGKREIIHLVPRVVQRTWGFMTGSLVAWGARRILPYMVSVYRQPWAEVVA